MASNARSTGTTALSLAALGVVFGDLGTSPLYAVQTAFGAGELGIPLTPDGVYGIISMVFWVLTLVVTVKYVSFVMRADNQGEGGIMAKVLDGGWFPLTVALAMFTLFTTWHTGRRVVTAARTEEEGPLRDFIEELRTMRPAVNRVAGTAVFLNANPETTPLALRANVEHNHTLHESVVIVSVDIGTVPNVPEAERVTVDDLGYLDDGILHVTVRYGFQDKPDVPAALRLADAQELECSIDVPRASYFLSRVVLRRGPEHNMARWRKALFLTSARLAANPVEYFELPIDRTVVMGGLITV